MRRENRALFPCLEIERQIDRKIDFQTTNSEHVWQSKIMFKSVYTLASVWTRSLESACVSRQDRSWSDEKRFRNKALSLRRQPPPRPPIHINCCGRADSLAPQSLTLWAFGTLGIFQPRFQRKNSLPSTCLLTYTTAFLSLDIDSHILKSDYFVYTILSHN